jgi:hypothetical protein
VQKEVRAFEILDGLANGTPGAVDPGAKPGVARNVMTNLVRDDRFCALVVEPGKQASR